MAGGEDTTFGELDVPDVLPLLPVRDVVVFPAMVVPLFVSREVSLSAVEQALKTPQRLVFAVAQRHGNDDAPHAPRAFTAWAPSARSSANGSCRTAG